MSIIIISSSMSMCKGLRVSETKTNKNNKDDNVNKNNSKKISKKNK